jgi:hypothetical protein
MWRLEASTYTEGSENQSQAEKDKTDHDDALSLTDCMQRHRLSVSRLTCAAWFLLTLFLASATNYQ